MAIQLLAHGPLRYNTHSYNHSSHSASRSSTSSFSQSHYYLPSTAPPTPPPRPAPLHSPLPTYKPPGSWPQSSWLSPTPTDSPLPSPKMVVPLTASALAEHNGVRCACQPCASSTLKKMMRSHSVVAEHGSVVGTSRVTRPPKDYFALDSSISSYSSSSTGAVVNVRTHYQGTFSNDRRGRSDRNERSDSRSSSRSHSRSRSFSQPASAPINIPRSDATRQQRESLHPDDAYDVARSLSPRDSREERQRESRHRPRDSLQIQHNAYERAKIMRHMSRLSLSPPKSKPPPAPKRVRFELDGRIKYPGY